MAFGNCVVLQPIYQMTQNASGFESFQSIKRVVQQLQLHANCSTAHSYDSSRLTVLEVVRENKAAVEGPSKTQVQGPVRIPGILEQC